MVVFVVGDQLVGNKRKERAFLTCEEKTRVRLAEIIGPGCLALLCQNQSTLREAKLRQASNSL